MSGKSAMGDSQAGTVRREAGTRRGEGTAARLRKGAARRPWAVHILAFLWMAWVAAAVAKAGGDPWPWLWGFYVVGVYILVVTTGLRWRLPLLVLLAGFLWWAGSWGGPGPGVLSGGVGAPGVALDGAAVGRPGWPVAGSVGAPGDGGQASTVVPGAPASGSGSEQPVSWWGTTAAQLVRVVGAALDGRWTDLLVNAQGPLGRGAAVLLCGLTTWVFARSVERGLIWTWLLAGEMVLALTDSFFVNQAVALVGTVILGILLAATARGLWWGQWKSCPKRALAAGLALSVTAGGVGLLVPKEPPAWPDPLQLLTGRSSAPLKKIGYGENDLELGGSFVQDSTVAFTVIAPEATYYRGETRDVYTGHGWAASPSSADNRVFQALLQGGRLPWPADGTLYGVSTRTLRQSITVQSGPLPVVVAAYPLTRVVSVALNHEGAFRTDPAGAWMSFGNLMPGDRYTVESSVPVSVPEGAKQALPADPAGLPPTVRADLQLPPDVPARVVQLARTITADQPSVYGKAQALIQYLKSHYQYETQQIPVPRPGQDFVDQFLFESKIGYCDHFSTAMAVMARSVGLPTRWVKGFAPGRPVQTLDSGNKLYAVSNADAHSWVEIWIPGYGWMPFDPTPSVASGAPGNSGALEAGGSNGQDSPQGSGAAGGSASPQNPSRGTPPPPSVSGGVNGPGSGYPGGEGTGGELLSRVGLGGVPGRILLGTGVGVLVILAAGAAVTFVLRRRGWTFRRVPPETRQLFATPPPQDAGDAVGRLQDWYVRRGHPLTRDTTVRDIVQTLAWEVPQAASSVGRLLAALESALYGQGPEGPAEESKGRTKPVTERVVPNRAPGAVQPGPDGGAPDGQRLGAVSVAWQEIARIVGESQLRGRWRRFRRTPSPPM
ncbi:MAG: transglutaminase domain-containing protein [Kyrpidia tusciae]|nr:transglutaminase domain-containing protein [Kyrpidia tusciae]MBE3553389.1 transglutaminase domain-containing protein [Kyrpidia tusciae]